FYSCFLSLVFLQPTSTLCPYTTLFRSRRRRRRRAAGSRGAPCGGCYNRRAFPARFHMRTRVTVVVSLLALAVAASPVAGQRSPADRKSTRLNSSHVKISYAVFCLKKKK